MMESTTKQSNYTAIQRSEDFDLENDSDTTLNLTDFQEKPSKRTRKFPRTSTRLTQQVLVWARWFTVVAIQTVIVYLLIAAKNNDEQCMKIDIETGGDVNGLYVATSHQHSYLELQKMKFVPNLTNDDNRMEVRQNWDMLMPLGSGAIRIPDHERHPLLGQPQYSHHHAGPIFETAWTHALHCLYYHVDTYHQLIVSHGTKFGYNGTRNDAHAVHCFEYLRTQLMCMADMTLEGKEGKADLEGGAAGAGGPQHVCRDMGETKRWIEERRVDDLRSIVFAA